MCVYVVVIVVLIFICCFARSRARVRCFVLNFILLWGDCDFVVFCCLFVCCVLC